jgi:aspartate 1-decarboxylase
MLFTIPYTANSVVDYVVDIGGITTGTTVFSFPKSFLQLNHLSVYHKLNSDPTTTYTLSGTTGAGSVVLNGTFPARASGDTIRIIRKTPATSATRLIDFQAGSIASGDLDTSALQDLYCVQEAEDRIAAMAGVLQVQLGTALFPPGYSWATI